MAKKKMAKKRIMKAVKTSKVPGGVKAEKKALAIKSRLDASGKSSRVLGHVSARTKRAQAKRDSING
jgi:hypothetical protein